MNRFLNKKKGAEDGTSPPLSGMKWRKTKKAPVEEEKPSLDFASVLPPSDDFRTSLIMPTLSTRFSMLREQDDPHTKMGKASDDSVLLPQRQSRLLDFGFSSNNLNDIAEVASIRSSIRPPFAEQQRHDSYGSEEGYGTDNDSTMNGSVMSRARPGEGNVLFGGRQKVYKIPTGSARSIHSTTDKGMGKVLYEDDLNLSAFQKYRAQQQRDAAASTSVILDDYENELDMLSPSTGSRPSLGEDEAPARSSEEPANAIGLGLSHSASSVGTFKRSSDSTTTSAPSQGRTSTAATSVASQSIGAAVTTPVAQAVATPAPVMPTLERSMTKRRLYEQGLEKNMHEQQASTLTRLNSIQRQRSPTVGSLPSSQGVLAHSRSIGHMQERGFQPYALQNPSQPALNRLPPLPLAPFRKPASSIASSPVSPLSPTMSDAELEDYKTLTSAMEPSDRGKATAMGAFNRPNQKYDENQYAQRQIQMQQSTQPGMLRKNSVDQSGMARKTSVDQSGMARKNSVDVAKHAESNLARFDSARHANETVEPPRDRSRSVSSQAEQTTNKAFSVFQNAAIQNRAAHGDNPNQSPPLPQGPSVADTHMTFFGDISASDDEEEDIVSDFERSGSQYAPSSYMTASSSNGRFTPTALHSVSEHPALRHENIPEVDEEEEEEEQILPIMSPAKNRSLHSIDTACADLPRSSSEYVGIDSPTIGGKDVDSPTIGPMDVDSPTIKKQDGLGGIMHHLRNTSDQSSIYLANQPYDDLPAPGFRGQGKPQYDQQASNHYSVANAWDLEELASYYEDDVPNNATSNLSGPPPARGQPFAPATSKANMYPSRPSTRDSDVIDGGMWQNDFKKQHTRDTSTATMAERQAFDDELAARQRAIQEKMRSVNESRGNSPAPSAAGALKAFGMLKSKPSREAMNRDGPPKTMKMRGLGNQPEKYSIYEDPQASTSRIVPQGGTWTPSSNPQWPLAGPKEQRNVSDPPSIEESRVASGRSTPQHPANRDRSRSRSNSAASKVQARSRSRTGGYRDEFDAPPVVPQVPMVRPSIDTNNSMTPTSVDTSQGRVRSNSRAGYFDQRALHPSHNGTPGSHIITPGSMSPASAMSPAGYPTSASSMRRPSYATLNSAKSGSPAVGVPHIPAARPAGSLLRKKTINKADIGEPKLISSTSNVDTVDLPTARTIVQPPLIPALNPRRRMVNQDNMSYVEGSRNAFSPPPPQHAATFAARPHQGWDANDSQKNYPRSVRSQESIAAQAARFDAIGSPVMNEAGMF